METQTNNRVKMVDSVDNKVVDLLTSSDPFGGAACGKENCYPFLTKYISLEWLPCCMNNLTYKVTCLRCKDMVVIAEYHAESKDSLYKRALGHMENLKFLYSANIGLTHNLLYHGNEGPKIKEYIVAPTKFHTKALERQDQNPLT